MKAGPLNVSMRFLRPWYGERVMPHPNDYRNNHHHSIGADRHMGTQNEVIAGVVADNDAGGVAEAVGEAAADCSHDLP